MNTSPQTASIMRAASARLFNEKCKRIGYWGATAAIAVIMAQSGFAYLRFAPAVFDQLGDLPFPGGYWMLGLIEVLGSAVLLVPRLPRLKLWAYAVFALVFGNDVVSGFASSEKRLAFASLIALLLLGISFCLRPAARRR